MKNRSKPDSHAIKNFAAEAGFDLCGIAPVEPPERDKRRFIRWIERGYQGEMDYLARDPERRLNPQLSLTDARAIIVVALNYYQAPSQEIGPGEGRIAMYARGRDYHKVFEEKYKRMLESIADEYPDLDLRKCFKSYVDYGPVLERSAAEQAGLGFIGKNSMLITKQFGSWVLLGTILTTLELKFDSPIDERYEQCGSCTRCLHHCPTGAIEGPGIVNANKCISYLTIEKRGEIDSQYHEAINDNLFGCDICQDVCPFNHPLNRAKETSHPELTSQSGLGAFIDLKRIVQFENEEEFKEWAAGTPLTRPKREGLQRNASICQQNQKNSDH